MVKRIKAKFNNDTVAATRISLRLFAQDLIIVPSPNGDSPKPVTGNGRRELQLDEAVALKNRLIKDWNSLHSEEIVEALNYLWTEKNIDLSLIDSDIQNELWLLRALAQERDLYSNFDHIEESYQRCRGGQFQIVLVLNNLGVIHARRQWCKQSIDLFKEAIRYALAFRVQVKAPFYNYALILHHLHQQRLVFRSTYLAGLDETSQLLNFAKQQQEPDAILGFRKETSKLNWTESEIERAYKEVAKYGHDMPGFYAGDFFHSKISYIDPSEVLFGSFGDVSDRRDRQAAHLLFQKGITFAEGKQFADSINTIKMATLMDPDFSIEADQKTEQVSDLWRREKNQEIIDLITAEDFDKAVKELQYLPDDRLKRHGDRTMIETIQKQKQLALLKKADELVKEGKQDKAEGIYVALLEEELDDDLRAYISNRLLEL